MESIWPLLERLGLSFVSGVPDSVLSEIVQSLSHTNIEHRIAACEGSAVALAAGHSLASGTLSCVYLQNSGFPNAMNPLMSMLAPAAFDIPLVLVIGWRGQPGEADEPQHSLIGSQTIKLLEVLGIETVVLTNDTSESDVEARLRNALSQNLSVALLIPRGTRFSKGANSSDAETNLDKNKAVINRADCIRTILSSIPSEALVFSGIGHTSRELLHLKECGELKSLTDFPCVGAMGFASHFAIGAALANSARPVYCLDGDGSFLMHGLGNSVVSSFSGRFRHIVLNNGCHSSVGGHPTVCPDANLADIAATLGYGFVRRASTQEELEESIEMLLQTKSSAFLEILCDCDGFQALPRPKVSLREIKTEFLDANSLSPYRHKF